MRPILEVADLWKSYRLGAAQSGYLTLREWLLGLQPKRSKTDPTFWALQNVGFSVYPGDTVGIIGRNGAGKSTLLKILSKITPPTRGGVTIRGRIASLLEVGTGFHYELTGRENIYLNGAILGMQRQEIKKQFDEIVSFSGVERFLDTTLKHYSSGMQLRLAFSVAAHLEPEILLIDEVLAVGDAAFQKKCLGKMNEVSRSGRTILFVSHNMGAVAQLCNKGILIDGGCTRYIGTVDGAIRAYMDTVTEEQRVWQGEHAPLENLRILSVLLRPQDDSAQITTAHFLDVVIDFEVLGPAPNIAFEVWCRYEDGTLLFCAYTNLLDLARNARKAVCRIPANLLNEGFHSIDIGVSGNYVYALLKIDNALSFHVAKYVDENDYSGKDPGIIRPLLRWEIDNQPVNTQRLI
ncbi:MAG: ABC transporter ATP-binding protein [Saprospiraceae bacterium]|nr:ABC transporter ATP-binding protein [Saprospiraceae bacterium]